MEWKSSENTRAKLFNKKCKYADCEWPGCGEEADRLPTLCKETWGGPS